MISKKMLKLIGLSIPLFISHGTEEYLTGFYHTDPFSLFVFSYFKDLPSLQATFFLFQIMIALLLIISFLLLLGDKWRLRLLFVFGSVFIFELHHLIKAILVSGYYPGLYTAFGIYILGFFYWKELLKISKAR